MDEKEWHTFITVVTEGNITRAAEKLFLSQPALSYRLRHMEEEMDCPLLLRTNDGMTLTPQGEVFYEYCQRMVQETELMRQSMGQLTGEVSGTLKIGASINFADYELPVLLHSFTAKYPKIHIQVKTRYSQQIQKMYNTGEVNVAIARGAYSGQGKQVFLLDEPYCLANKDKISHEELSKRPLIQYRTDPSIQTVFDNWCSENLPAGTQSAMELDSMVTCRHFIREGLGWSILPYMGLGSCRDEGIYIEPIFDSQGQPLTRPTYLYYDDKVSMQLPAVRTFIEYVLEYYKHRIPQT